MDIKKVEKDSMDTLRNLLQSYEGEFSAITKKVPDERGVFDLDCNLQVTDNYLLYREGSPIGFCVKGEEQGVHDIYEFYIVPSQRGGGLGADFARYIFRNYPGKWQVRQIQGADKARDFWRSTISKFTGGNYQEEQVSDEYWGVVTRQTFLSS